MIVISGLKSESNESVSFIEKSETTVKQRTTAVIHNARLMLYNNGKNPKVPRLIIDLTEAFAIIGGIEANCRFCIVDGSQTKHEFEVMLVIENELYTYYLLDYIKFVK